MRRTTIGFRRASFAVPLRPFGLILWASLIMLACPAAADEPALTIDDRFLLDGLFTNFLFDPRGATFVRATVFERLLGVEGEPVERFGWLKVGAGGERQLYFTDGWSRPAEKVFKVTEGDFTEDCKARLSEELPEAITSPWEPDRFPSARDRNHLKQFPHLKHESDLVLAAWLHRVGHDDLAAAMLVRARAESPIFERGLTNLRSEMASYALQRMLAAYLAHEDDEALAHAERLIRMYTDAPEDYTREAEAITRDLARRKKQGNLGQPPTAVMPRGYDDWDAQRKLAFLIESLEDVDLGGYWDPPLGNRQDPRLYEIRILGDQAVSALIDAMETDSRLTRVVMSHPRPGFRQHVVSVRELAYTTAHELLHVENYDVRAPKHPANDDEQVVRKMAQLRPYWDEYGKLPFDERMMRILLDPQVGNPAASEAADRLANLERVLALPGTRFNNDPNAPSTNPALAKFQNPTVAEAILQAMDTQVARLEGQTDAESITLRENIEARLLASLIGLRDKRATPAIIAHSKAVTGARSRREWSIAAHRLGDSGPLNNFLVDLAAGKVIVTLADLDDRHPTSCELHKLLEVINGLRTKESDQAFWALAEPDHPMAAAMTELMRCFSPERYATQNWQFHPMVAKVLHRMLSDATLTGWIMQIYQFDAKLIQNHRGDEFAAMSQVPYYLAEPADRLERIEERNCDVAAMLLSRSMPGLPIYHPMMKDAPQRLDTIKATVDRLHDQIRLTTRHEADVFNRYSHPYWVPDLPVLGRGATAADVAAGRALFFLDGPGKPADLVLPAVGTLASTQNSNQPERVLILQAEVDPKGETYYGVVRHHGFATLAEQELIRVSSLPK